MFSMWKRGRVEGRAGVVHKLEGDGSKMNVTVKKEKGVRVDYVIEQVGRHHHFPASRRVLQNSKSPIPRLSFPPPPPPPHPIPAYPACPPINGRKRAEAEDQTKRARFRGGLLELILDAAAKVGSITANFFAASPLPHPFLTPPPPFSS